MRKNCSSDREKLLMKFEAEGREFAKFFEITRTIYSNSERSEQFLVTEYCSKKEKIGNVHIFCQFMIDFFDTKI